jgi:hypothetical protein
MSFLKRILGGDRNEQGADAAGIGQTSARGTTPAQPSTPDALAAEEIERERALLRADAERLNDDLIQRQLRYADRSWTPPAQGGERRADDADRGGSE